jgi:hypothetical protein
MEKLSKLPETNELPPAGDVSKFIDSLKEDRNTIKDFVESLKREGGLPERRGNLPEDAPNRELSPQTDEDKDRIRKERIDALKIFLEAWNNLTLEEKKQALKDLAGYIADETGNKNLPEIVFLDDLPDGTYGWYDPETNTIVINVNILENPVEAVDTVAHEMWHAYQNQCILDPTNEKGPEYKEAFDNYISPEYDYEGYLDQMVEVEAREYAQGYKDVLTEMGGAA